MQHFMLKTLQGTVYYGPKVQKVLKAREYIYRVHHLAINL